MNPLWGPVAGVFIVLMMLAFIGIWIWAWLPRHARSFGAMARLPLEEEASQQPQQQQTAKATGDAR